MTTSEVRKSRSHGWALLERGSPATIIDHLVRGSAELCSGGHGEILRFTAPLATRTGVTRRTDRSDLQRICTIRGGQLRGTPPRRESARSGPARHAGGHPARLASPCCATPAANPSIASAALRAGDNASDTVAAAATAVNFAAGTAATAVTPCACPGRAMRRRCSRPAAWVIMATRCCGVTDLGRRRRAAIGIGCGCGFKPARRRRPGRERRPPRNHCLAFPV